MSKNQCRACGQWSGKGHNCPVNASAVSPAAVPLLSPPAPEQSAHEIARRLETERASVKANATSLNETTIRQASTLRKEANTIREASRTLWNPFRHAYRKNLRRTVEAKYGPVDWNSH